MVPQDVELYPTLGPGVCQFIEERLVFGPGDLRGQPVVLDDETRALIYRLYEVFPKGHARAGRRRFKRCGLSLVKGMGKTEKAAWLAACELHPEAPVRCIGWSGTEPIGGPVSDPYIPMVAYTEEQSDELAYGALRIILEEGPLRNDFDIGLERILRKKGDGKAVSLSSSPNSRDGARTTFAVLDETHWWTTPRLKQVHQTMANNLAKRKIADGWSLEITTAPAPGAGSVAEATMDYAAAVADGRISDASFFFFHRQAGDEHDLTTPEGARAAIVEASGPAAEWRDLDAIMAVWSDPSTDLAYWERAWCNRLVKASGRAFDPVRWADLAKPSYTVKRRAQITLGFDGSRYEDSTALIGTEIRTGFQFVCGLWERPLNATKWEVPKAEVDAVVATVFETYDVWRLYADPPYWEETVATWSGIYGEKRVLTWFTNRTKPMANAVRAFTNAIIDGSVSHNGDEHLARHISNAHKRPTHLRDDQDRPLWTIQKERDDSPLKIDGAMAAILSWDARCHALELGLGKEPKKSQGAKIWTPRGWAPA